MKKYQIKIWWSVFLLVGSVAKSMAQTDTAALIKEFTNVINFSDQPYIYYNTVTKVTSFPLLQSQDTMTLYGSYYKDNAILYANNGADETFLQDSLLFRINRARKSIWIDKSSGVLNQGNDAITNQYLQTLFRQKYSIEKTTLQNGHSMIGFENKVDTLHANNTNMSITLEYDSKTNFPASLEIEIRMKMQASEELENALNIAGIDLQKVTQKIDGKEYFTRIQKMSLTFLDINTSKEKLQEIPLWGQRIDYDNASGQFKGKGIYSGYETAKMF